MKSIIKTLILLIKAPVLLVTGILNDLVKIGIDLIKRAISYIYEASDVCVKNLIGLFREMNLQCQYWIRENQSSRLLKPILFICGTLLFIFLFASTLNSYFFIVEAGDTAVVTRFGKVDRYVSPGLGFKFPWVEKYYVVETEMIREVRFGFRQGPNLFAKMRQIENPQERYVMDVYQKSVEASEAPLPGLFDNKGNFQLEIDRKQRMTHDYLRRRYSPPLDKSALAIKERTAIRERLNQEAKRLGMRPDGKISMPKERQLLTGDMSIVLLEWTLQFIVSDVKSYLFNSRDVEQNIRDVGASVMNEVIGEFRLEEVITTGRKTIELAVQQRAQEILNQYDVGITVTQVIILNALPPKRVEFAFDEVNKAAQDMENLKYQAEIEYLKVIPEAEGKASRLLNQAKAYAVDIVNKAQGEAGQFTLVNKEYLKAPEITEDRIYIETMENLFKNTPTIIMDKRIKGIMPIFMGKGPKRKKTDDLLEKGYERLIQSSETFKQELKRFSSPTHKAHQERPMMGAVQTDPLKRSSTTPNSSAAMRSQNQTPAPPSTLIGQSQVQNKPVNAGQAQGAQLNPTPPISTNAGLKTPAQGGHQNATIP